MIDGQTDRQTDGLMDLPHIVNTFECFSLVTFLLATNLKWKGKTLIAPNPLMSKASYCVYLFIFRTSFSF